MKNLFEELEDLELEELDRDLKSSESSMRLSLAIENVFYKDPKRQQRVDEILKEYKELNNEPSNLEIIYKAVLVTAPIIITVMLL